MGYFVHFSPGTDSYRNEMKSVRYSYDEEKALPENEFFRPGYIFAGWTYPDATETLADGQMVKNLTTERNITLTALWTICKHEEKLFTYSVSGDDTIIRQCFCETCTQRAILTAENTTYVDGNTTPYEADVRIVTEVSNGEAPPVFDPAVDYSGVYKDEDDKFLIYAGNYSVSMTADGQTVSADFEIYKATRTPPAKPEYESVTNGGNNQIIVKDPGDITGVPLQYQITWYDEGGVLSNSEWESLDVATTSGFTLSTTYTNYYVYVRYAGDENHYPSDAVRADSAFFYEGENVLIRITSEDGIGYTTGAIEGQRGIQINVFASSDKYYLFGTAVKSSSHPSLDIDELPSSDGKKTFTVMNIPTATEGATVEVNIEITGVRKYVSVSAYITDDEVFGNVSGNSAIITRDSAFTAHFVISGFDVYTDPSICFDSALPVNATVILMDKTASTTGFWTYKVETATNQIYLKDFVRMGTAGEKFSVVPNGSESFKYQFIVDFSQSNGCSGESLNVSLTAAVSEADIALGASLFPSKSVTATLKDVAVSSIEILSAPANVQMQKELQIKYLSVSSSATASKWDGRRGALVLTPSETLPVDVCIEAVNAGGMRSLHYLNADGKFIIPLSGGNTDTVRVTLISSLFPKGEKTYSFNAELMSADSLAATAPINGTLLVDPITIEFSKEEDDAAPSLMLSSDKKLYYVGDTVTVSVDYDTLPQNTGLVLRLLNKDMSTGTYIDTGWKPQTEPVKGSNMVPLGSNLSGSCCIMLELRDNMGNVVMSAPFYFVIYDK